MDDGSMSGSPEAIASVTERLRFGRFEFLPASGQLLRGGTPVRLQAQPAKVLALLVQRRGDLVTREELQRAIWGSDTHVDFERGLNFCIAQVRAALGDSSDSPRYIETVPKQGYCFIAPIMPETQVDGAPVPRATPPVDRRRAIPLALALVAGICAAVATYSLVRSAAAGPTVVVIPFYNETGNSASSTIASSLSDALVARLAAPERVRSLSVIGNAPALRNPFARVDVQEISRKLGAGYVIIGQLKTDGSRLRLVAHLIRVADMKHLWANTYDDDRFMLDAQARTAEAVAAAVTASLATGE